MSLASALRDHLVRALEWDEAHVAFDRAIAGIPPERCGTLAPGFEHTLWQLLEHIRIAQRDILDFCVDAAYAHAMRWPEDYWPRDAAPSSARAWTDSVEACARDREALQAVARDTEDLAALVPTGSGTQTYLRAILLTVDHTAYHVGQIVAVRRALGIWPGGLTRTGETIWTGSPFWSKAPVDVTIPGGGGLAARRTDEGHARTKERIMKRWVPIAVLVFVVAMVAWGVSGYNALVRLDQGVRSAWGQVENVYQRRADLVPNLVETVKGAAAFEKDTFTAVANARAQVGQVSAAGVERMTTDPEAMARFQQAQDALSSALSRLLVVSERYPELKATAAFRDLQVQLEGTENRIAVERMRFNEAAQAFNTRRQSFPTVVIAGFLGDRFREKPYFKAQAGAETAPKVTF